MYCTKFLTHIFELFYQPNKVVWQLDKTLNIGKGICYIHDRMAR